MIYVFYPGFFNSVYSFFCLINRSVSIVWVCYGTTSTSAVTVLFHSRLNFNAGTLKSCSEGRWFVLGIRPFGAGVTGFFRLVILVRIDKFSPVPDYAKGQRRIGGRLGADPARFFLNWSYHNVGCESKRVEYL